MIDNLRKGLDKIGLPMLSPVFGKQLYEMMWRRGKEKYEQLQKEREDVRIDPSVIENLTEALSNIGLKPHDDDTPNDDDTWRKYYPAKEFGGERYGKSLGTYEQPWFMNFFGDGFVLHAYPRIHVILNGNPPDDFYDEFASIIRKHGNIINFLKYRKEARGFARRRGGIHINLSNSEEWKELYKELIELEEKYCKNCENPTIKVEADVYFLAGYEANYNGKSVFAPMFPFSYSQMLTLETESGRRAVLEEKASEWLGIKKDRLYSPDKGG